MHVGTLTSSMLPTQFSWSYLQPAAYTMHVKTFPSSQPPTQFTWHYRREHLYPVYFRYQKYFLFFSFNQGPTSATPSTDVKGVFKSISNRSPILSYQISNFHVIDIQSKIVLAFTRHILISLSVDVIAVFCQKVMKFLTLYIYIYICVVVFSGVFNTFLWYQVILSNANKWHTITWF